MKTFDRKFSKPLPSKIKPLHIIWISLGAICLILNLLPRFWSEFAEFYSANIYPIWVFIVAHITNLFPFSLLEFGIITLALLIITGIIFLTIKLIRNKKPRFDIIKRAVAVVLTTALSLFTILSLNCNVNYYRIPFSEKSGLDYADGYYVEDLLQLMNAIFTKANALSETVPVDENGYLTLNGTDVNAVSQYAMQKLGEEYPSLSGYYPNAKGIVFSYQMSMLRLCGIYSPFTIEANYNTAMPDYNKPFTICHELSHLKGYMREDEANFISFKACIDSENDVFKYSAYINAVAYCLNALYDSVSEDDYYAVFNSLSDSIINEIRHKNQYWKQFDTPVAQVYNSFNDTYLKIQSQQEGVKSYGRFVDLLIYDFKNNPEQY